MALLFAASVSRPSAADARDRRHNPDLASACGIRSGRRSRCGRWSARCAMGGKMFGIKAVVSPALVGADPGVRR
ncbi:MAG: hypothetical protein IPI73_03890 [Betaproteobacteria bacterium]|nr:hypothetical protein [Betaproteobacteria bacterium]